MPAEPASEPEQPRQTLLQQIQGFGPDDWQGKKLYVYRVWPVIDRKGEDHFIAKLSETVDEDFLLQNWGSGKYSLRLNGRTGETIATQTVAIHNPKFPPKLDSAQVVQSDPRNETYFAVWGPRAAAEPAPAPAESTAIQELSRLAGKVLDQRAAPAPAAPPNAIGEATTALILGMSQGRDALAEKLASHTAGGADPVGALDRAVDLLKKLQPATPVDSKLELVAILRDELTDVRKQLAEDRAEQRRLQQELFAAKTTPPVARDLADEFTKNLQTFNRVREQVAPGTEGIPSATEPNSWVTFLSSQAGGLAVNKVLTLVDVLVQKLAPRSTPPAPSAATVAAPAPSPGQQPPAPQAQPPAFIQRVAPALMNYVRNDKLSGGDFAEWIWDGYGPEIDGLGWMNIKSAIGAEAIMGMFRQSQYWPELGLIEQRFQTFLDEFVAWQPEAADPPLQPDYEEVPTEQGE